MFRSLVRSFIQRHGSWFDKGFKIGFGFVLHQRLMCTHRAGELSIEFAFSSSYCFTPRYILADSISGIGQN